MIFTGIGKVWDDKKQSTLCEFSPKWDTEHRRPLHY